MGEGWEESFTLAIGMEVVAMWVLIIQREDFHKQKKRKIFQINRLSDIIKFVKTPAKKLLKGL